MKIEDIYEVGGDRKVNARIKASKKKKDPTMQSNDVEKPAKTKPVDGTAVDASFKQYKTSKESNPVEINPQFAKKREAETAAARADIANRSAEQKSREAEKNASNQPASAAPVNPNMSSDGKHDFAPTSSGVVYDKHGNPRNAEISNRTKTQNRNAKRAAVSNALDVEQRGGTKSREQAKADLKSKEDAILNQKRQEFDRQQQQLQANKQGTLGQKVSKGAKNVVNAVKGGIQGTKDGYRGGNTTPQGHQEPQGQEPQGQQQGHPPAKDQQSPPGQQEPHAQQIGRRPPVSIPGDNQHSPDANPQGGQQTQDQKDMEMDLVQPFLRDQVSKGKREADLVGDDGNPVDQGAEYTDIQKFLQTKFPDVPPNKIQSAFDRIRGKYPEDQLYTFRDSNVGGAKDSKPGNRAKPVTDQPSSGSLPDVGGNDTGSWGPGQRNGGNWGGQQRNVGGQQKGNLDNRTKQELVKQIKSLTKTERKWLIKSLEKDMKTQSARPAQESVMREAKELTVGEAEYRIRKFSEHKGLNPDEVIATWEDEYWKTTDVGKIKDMLNSMGGKKVNPLNKGKMWWKDMNVGAQAKTLYSFIRKHGVEKQVINYLKPTGFIDGMKRAFSMEDIEQMDGGVISEKKNKNKNSNSQPKNALLSDKFIRDLFARIGSSLEANNESVSLPDKTNSLSEASKRRLAMRIFKQYSTVNESVDSGIAMSVADFKSACMFLWRMNITVESVGLSVKKNKNTVIITEKKKIVSETKVTDYLSKPVNKDTVSNIVRIIDANNVGGSLNSIRKSITDKFNSNVDAKTLHSVSDELLKLASRGINLDGI